MEQAQLEYFRKLLQKKLDDLLGEADKTLEEMTDMNNHFPDPTDRASVESDRSGPDLFGSDEKRNPCSRRPLMTGVPMCFGSFKQFTKKAAFFLFFFRYQRIPEAGHIGALSTWLVLQQQLQLSDPRLQIL